GSTSRRDWRPCRPEGCACRRGPLRCRCRNCRPTYPFWGPSLEPCSALDPRKIRHRVHGGAYAVEQFQPVQSQIRLIRDIDCDLIEQRVDGRTQGGERAHRPREIFARERWPDRLLDVVERRSNGLLFALFQQSSVRCASDLRGQRLVLLLL